MKRRVTLTAATRARYANCSNEMNKMIIRHQERQTIHDWFTGTVYLQYKLITAQPDPPASILAVLYFFFQNIMEYKANEITNKRQIGVNSL